MIQAITDTQKDLVISYINNNYPKCLYLYLDILKYSIDKGEINAWIIYEGQNIQAVMLKYHTALHIYTDAPTFEARNIINLVLEQSPSIICAEPLIIKSLEPHLKSKGYISEYGYIGRFNRITTSTNDENIMLATYNDIPEIADLLLNDEDIGASYTKKDLENQIRERMETNFTRSYISRENDKIVCHFGTGAEINKICTINYLVTRKEYRGKGYATRITNFICSKLKGEGYEIFSVYYPENSRKLHHKAGFTDYCRFGKLFLNKNK